MNILYTNKYIPKQLPEKHFGNKEYKLSLLVENSKFKKTKYTNSKKYIMIEKRSTQMLFRILEGNGKALYLIGIDDNGKNIGIEHNTLMESIENLKLMCKNINASIKSIRIYNGLNGYIGSVRIMMNKELLEKKKFNTDNI